MLNKQKDWFVKDNYWNHYSRALQRMGGTFDKAIDVSVEPINGDFENEWEGLKEVRIRVHTTLDKGDVFRHHFPDHIESNLIEMIGPEITKNLLHDDLLKEIDWKKFKKIDAAHTGGGGIPFILICRNPTKFPHLRSYWAKLLKGTGENAERARSIQAVHDGVLEALLNSKARSEQTTNSTANYDTVLVGSNTLGIPRGEYKTKDLGCKALSYSLINDRLTVKPLGGLVPLFQATLSPSKEIAHGEYTSSGKINLIRRALAGHVIEARFNVFKCVCVHPEINTWGDL